MSHWLRLALLLAAFLSSLPAHGVEPPPSEPAEEQALVAPGDLIAASAGAGTLNRVEPATLRQTVLVDDHPVRSIALTPDGDLITAINGLIARVDLETAEVTPIRSGSFAAGNVEQVVVGPTGRIFMIRSYPDDLWEMDPETGDAHPLFEDVDCEVSCSRTRLSALALLPDGRFLVALAGNFASDGGFLVALDPETGTSEVVSAHGLLDSPSSIVPESADSFLVADLDTRAIIRVSLPDGAQSLVAQGDKLETPHRIALGGNGRIYVSQLGAALVEIDPETGVQRVLAPSRPSLRAIAVVPGEPAPPACDNGIDDDADGKTDFPSDPGCTGSHDGTEEPPCDDGLDNDRDGLVDYPDDPGCEGPLPWFDEGPQCSDGIDNDGDGLFDHPEDPECLAPHDNTESWRPAYGQPPEKKPTCGLLGVEVLPAALALAWRRRGSGHARSARIG